MNKPLRVLMVEDSESDAGLIIRRLQQAGYDLVHERVETAGAMRTALAKPDWDIVLADYRMPQFSASAALEILKKSGRDLPFIIISGTIGEEKAVALMKAGAHDYVMKHNLARLVPAVARELGEAEGRQERRRAEEALRESEDLYRSLFDNMLNGFAYFKMLFEDNQPQDLIFLSVNHSFEPLTGLKDVVGEKVSQVIPGMREADPELFEIFGRVALTGKPEKLEIYVTSLEKWFAISAYSPAKEYFVVVFDVITERKRVEKELRLKERMLDGASDSIFLHDLDGHFTYVNEAAYKSRGYEKEELLAKDIFALPTPEYAATREKRLAELLEKGEAVFESAHFRKDGSIMPVEIQARVFDLDDRPVILSAARDITERKQAETQVKQGLDRLHQALQGTVVALANTVEIKDPYTAGHQRRVAQLSSAMARELGWSPDRVEGMQVLCFLHDMGKIAVPAEILNKPGKISLTEFSLIKVHPQVGYDILKDIAFPWPVAQGVVQHHERLDGSGYPSGLTAEQITPEAKILAVADVVEAMASHRPYRPSLGIDQALGEITQNRGTLYDPDAVDACVRLLTEKDFRFD